MVSVFQKSIEVFKKYKKTSPNNAFSSKMLAGEKLPVESLHLLNVSSPIKLFVLLREFLFYTFLKFLNFLWRGLGSKTVKKIYAFLKYSELHVLLQKLAKILYFFENFPFSVRRNYIYKKSSPLLTPDISF